MQEFLADYMPMKFGTPLTNKLNKVDSEGRHYWEKEETKDKPFVHCRCRFPQAGRKNNSWVR